MRYADSVKDIRVRCERMLKDASRYDREDVYAAYGTLKASLSKLITEFEEEKYDEKAIAALKENTEYHALQLENVLARVDEVYKERYITRVKILNCFERSKKDICEKQASKDVSDKLVDYYHLEKMARAVGHIEFYLEEEDIRFLGLFGVDGLCVSQS